MVIEFVFTDDNIVSNINVVAAVLFVVAALSAMNKTVSAIVVIFAVVALLL